MSNPAAASLNHASLLDKAEHAVERFHRLQDLGLIVRGGSFYPSIIYPPISQHAPIQADQLWPDYTPPDDTLFSTYINVPFCKRRCAFCHIPVSTGGSAEDRRRFIDVLDVEMDMVMSRLGLDRIPTRDMLWGGGTPTELSPELLDHLMVQVDRRLDLSQCTQISADVDPLTLLGTIGDERLAVLHEHGVRRLAIGAQELDDAVLRKMSRGYTGDDVERVIDKARRDDVGVNIELIYGYPGQTLQSWARTVDRARRLPVDEIQIYRLQIIPYRERNRHAQGMYRLDPKEFATPDDAMRMQQMATDLLTEAGFNENRRRFFCKTPDDYSHYQSSWTVGLQDQIGFGPAAMSNLRDRYGQNVLDLGSWLERILQGREATAVGQRRDADDQTRWAFFFPLRHFRADAAVFAKATGRDLYRTFPTKVQRLRDEGLIEDWAEGSARGLRLTELGSFFVDEVMQQFQHPRYLVFPRLAYADGPLNPYLDNDPDD